MDDNENNDIGFFDDNGEKLDPNLIVKPSLCTTCEKDDYPDQEIFCNLNRLDQKDEKDFECYAYESKFEDDTDNDDDEDIGNLDEHDADTKF